jgi:2-dehydro-3-deoxygluconokinase
MSVDPNAKRYDLLTVGESMLRFSVPPTQLLTDAPSFDVHVAGAESNVAVAVSHMGFKAGWLSRLPNNPLGLRAFQTLSGYGVDCSEAIFCDQERMGTYFIEFANSPRATTVTYDRKYSAASKMDETTFDLALIGQARCIHLTGITAAISDGCYRLLQRIIETANALGVHVVFDVNYRALLWDAKTCREKLTPLLKAVSTLLISRRDVEGVFGITGELPDMLNRLYEQFGVNQIAVTIGEKGAVGLERGKLFETPAYVVQMVDRIGAGDTFAAGVISGILEGDFALGMRYGVAMSALQLTLAGDIFRLGRADVLKLMNSGAASGVVR